MTRPIRILELRSVRGTGGGPEKTILYGAARADPRRFAVTVCYLRDIRDQAFAVGAKAVGLEVDYVELLERHSFDVRVFSALRALVRSRGIQIVHAHEYKSDLLAFALTKFENVVALATSHGWTGKSLREQLVYYPLDRWILSRFPRVISVSSDIRSALLERGCAPHLVTVVLNGIDHRRFRRDAAQRPCVREQLGLASNALVVGAVGRLERQKRFDLLLDAAARLLPDWPTLKLLIAGDGSLRTELEGRARTLLPKGTVTFLGNTPDVISLHCALDLFVQSSDYEGTPNALLEAMALETPVVATDVGGTSELAVDGVHGLIVPPGDAAALARAMERALRDRESARRRAVAARQRIEGDLSFDTRMRRVEAIYEELAAVSRGRQEKTCADGFERA